MKRIAIFVALLVALAVISALVGNLAWGALAIQEGVESIQE